MWNAKRNHGSAFLALVIALVAGASHAQTVDDTFLLTTSVSPNVVILIDNSKAMNHIEWHPEFDPEAGGGCVDFDPARIYSVSELGNTETHCGRTRTIFKPTSETLWDGRYLRWYFSSAADPYVNEIETAEATPAGCNSAGSQTRFVRKYRRTRAEAAKQVILDVLCLSESRGIRFGLAEFREADDTGLVDLGEVGVDPNGGYLSVAVADPTPAHAADLEAAVGNTQDVEATPLGEAVFQIYTYLMPRDLAQLPVGNDGVVSFPPYLYDEKGDVPSNSSNILPDPMEFSCQKNFIIVVTTGLPTRDDFDRDPTSTSVGYDFFDNLIGDYYADGEVEVLGTADEQTLYLDDIVKYMQENDLRPDYQDDQTVDFYAVGFATSQSADAYLDRAADLGEGLFFHSQDGEQLSRALVAALNDIVEKSRSFTAATVPSARTADGGAFYNSFFLPSGKTAFWEGHLRSWHFTASGEIVDSNGDCALLDPDPGECNSGPFKPVCQPSQTADCVVPFWDAGEEVPPPGTSNTSGVRELYTSTLDGNSEPQRTDFDLALTPAHLTIDAFAAPPDPSPNSDQYPLKGSTALNAEGLADEVVAYARGCVFGTGVDAPSLAGNVATPLPCEARPWLLGDIFHSDPVVVRNPPRRNRGAAYESFRSTYGERDRVIYTGTNGGFLEALHAGSFDSATGTYDEGSGEELFGFMPWEPRRNIKKQPVDDPTARTHYVDGAPQVSDVWIYSDPKVATQNASEWRTVLVGGLREGGHHYYALDVTNPSNDTLLPYPDYMWEFPNEDDPWVDLPDMGQTWGQPIITKIKVQVDGVTNGGQGFDRWVAIVTAGYDPESDPNPLSVDPGAAYVASSTRGRGIYVLDLKTGKVIAEQKFEDGGAAPNGDMLYAIPPTPSVLDLNSDGYADVIYVGDLGGNLWKWVIHPIGRDRANDIPDQRDQPEWKFTKFFEAPVTTISGEDYYKNIFQPPSAAFVGGTLWIAFGTGERAAIGFEGIPGEDENNRFYAITDPDPYGLAATTPPALTEADLTDVTTVGTSVNSPRGYYFKVEDGQKFVTRTVIFAGRVITATFTPSQLGPGDPGFDPCTSRGNGDLFQFDLDSGEGVYPDDGGGTEARSVDIGSGLPTDPKVSVGVGGSNNRIVIEKSGTDIESQAAEDVEFGRGIIYWRELR